MCDMFGGPSSGENVAYQNQVGLTNSLRSAFNEQYATQKDVLNRLGSQIMRIQTGQTGPGYGGAENASRIALIQNQGAAAARNAIQAERTRSAGVGGGGTSGLARTAAINRQIAGGIEALSGANTSNALIREQAENFEQGRSNAISAASGLQSLAGDYNPSAYSSQALSSNKGQFDMAHTINQEKIAARQAMFGTALKAGLGAATFGVGAIGALGAGESLGEGVSDALSGGFNALSGTNFGINS